MTAHHYVVNWCACAVFLPIVNLYLLPETILNIFQFCNFWILHLLWMFSLPSVLETIKHSLGFQDFWSCDLMPQLTSSQKIRLHFKCFTLLKNASCCCIVPGSSWVFPGSACQVWEGVSAQSYQSPVFGFWECLWYPWREWAGQMQRKGKAWKAGLLCFVLHKETFVEMLRKVKWESWHFKTEQLTVCLSHVLWMNRASVNCYQVVNNQAWLWIW